MQHVTTLKASCRSLEVADVPEPASMVRYGRLYVEDSYDFH
jgi:hypothetical protein